MVIVLVVRLWWLFWLLDRLLWWLFWLLDWLICWSWTKYLKTKDYDHVHVHVPFKSTSDREHIRLNSVLMIENISDLTPCWWGDHCSSIFCWLFVVCLMISDRQVQAIFLSKTVKTNKITCARKLPYYFQMVVKILRKINCPCRQQVLNSGQDRDQIGSLYYIEDGEWMIIVQDGWIPTTWSALTNVNLME